MALKLIQQPQQEPLTLEQVKKHLRIDGNDLDSELLTYIQAARIYAETVTNYALATQTWDITYNEFPQMPVTFPKPPLQSVEYVKLTDKNGVNLILPESSYHFDSVSESGKLVFSDGFQWPSIELQPFNGIAIRFKCGFENPESMSHNIITAMLLHVRLLFESMGEKEQEYIEKARDSLLNMSRLWPV